jgi:hypothetical protein
MKKSRIIGGIALVLLLGLLLLYWFIRQDTKEASPSVTASLPSPPPTSSPSFLAPNQLSPEEARKASEAEVQHQNHVFELLFLTPIQFYGKVVDTAGTPIGGATVSISAADHLGDGDSKYEKTTDDAGLFSILTHGMGLVVNVSKEGYYKVKESAGLFGYSAMGGATNPHPDPHNPAIFVLRKMGDMEPLIMIHRDVKVPKDGTPTQMNLTTGYTYQVTNGDIQVEAWTHDEGIPPNGNHPYDWRCKITVLGGGLQPRTGGEFDFTAPENGYQPSDEISMPASDPKWRDSQNREYFLKLANGEYARISFMMGVGGDHFFSITSYLNPQPGHRNLEYDPKNPPSK